METPQLSTALKEFKEFKEFKNRSQEPESRSQEVLRLDKR